MNQIAPSAAVVRGFADADRPRVDISLKWRSLSCGNVKYFGLKRVQRKAHVHESCVWKDFEQCEKYLGETNFF